MWERQLAAHRAKVREVGHHFVDATCSLELARIQIQMRRYQAALATLQWIQSAQPISDRPEPEALAHYLRGLALASLGDEQRARDENSRTKMLTSQMRAKLPERWQRTYALRASIRPLLQNGSFSFVHSLYFIWRAQTGSGGFGSNGSVHWNIRHTGPGGGQFNGNDPIPYDQSAMGWARLELSAQAEVFPDESSAKTALSNAQVTPQGVVTLLVPKIEPMRPNPGPAEIEVDW